MMLSDKAKRPQCVSDSGATDIRNTMQDNWWIREKYEMYYGMVDDDWNS